MGVNFYGLMDNEVGAYGAVEFVESGAAQWPITLCHVKLPCQVQPTQFGQEVCNIQTGTIAPLPGTHRDYFPRGEQDTKSLPLPWRITPQNLNPFFLFS